ncbi:hypothetical protein EVAR_44451_1 [Eumeta japonica]|uniref:Uncharacterized protein n=1 Tax=Eumeta variegata TaxID=151549 RepID=A0A4C1WJ47_EUMVA|nr:hypothetical protein EVAR_44451_1 [Eumeta japonica]
MSSRKPRLTERNFVQIGLSLYGVVKPFLEVTFSLEPSDVVRNARSPTKYSFAAGVVGVSSSRGPWIASPRRGHRSVTAPAGSQPAVSVVSDGHCRRHDAVLEVLELAQRTRYAVTSRRSNF